MGRTPLDVRMHDVDLFWQNVFTYASWGIVVAMLVAGIVMGIRQRTPFYVIACLAAAVAAYAEPLYDVAFDLWFYDAQNGQPGAGYMHFSAFEVVQPVWTHSGYVILYASACLYAGRRIYEGRLGRKGLFVIWAAEVTASCVFEIVGTGTDVYTYYGPFVMRIWSYPLVIGILEGTQVILFTVVAVLVWRKVSTAWGLLSLFIVFPMTFFAANFGIGFPVIIAMHLDNGHATSAIIWAATIVTICACVFVVYGVSRFLPPAPDETRPDPAGDVDARSKDNAPVAG